MMTAHTNGPLQNCRALKSPLWSIIQTQVQPTALCQDLRLTAYKYYLYITTQCWCMIIIIIWMHDHVIFIRMKWSTLSNAALQSKKKRKKTAVCYIWVHTKAMQDSEEVSVMSMFWRLIFQRKTDETLTTERNLDIWGPLHKRRI